MPSMRWPSTTRILDILDINPESADALNNLGYLQHAYHHNDALAAEYYNRALAVDPNHQQAIQNINDIKQ